MCFNIVLYLVISIALQGSSFSMWRYKNKFKVSQFFLNQQKHNQKLKWITKVLLLCETLPRSWMKLNKLKLFSGLQLDFQK